MQLKKLTMFLLCALLLTSACKKEDDPDPNDDDDTNPNAEIILKLSLNNLPDLGSSAQYEGWIMVNGQPISTGTFTSSTSGKDFKVKKSDLSNATSFIVSIEPIPDPDAAPSKTHIVAGDFASGSNTAALTITHPSALGTDFSTAAGMYLLSTPTTPDSTDELNGVWFINYNDSTGLSSKGLDLPAPPDGWIYEGWAVSNNFNLSTGKFSDLLTKDMSDKYSGTNPGYNFPGEDFFKDPPTGAHFPPNLSTSTEMRVTLEPYPDNKDGSPFPFKILSALVLPNPQKMTSYSLSNTMVNFMPAGTATR